MITTQPQKEAELISLRSIAKNLNNVNLNEEILVFDHNNAFKGEDVFPIRIDALIIAICTAGTGKIGIDLKEFELKKNSLIVIQPRNYIFFSEYSSDFRCAMVACSNNVVQHVLPKLTDLLPLLMHHRAEPVTHLSQEEADGICNFHDFLKVKLRGPRTPFLKHKVMCMLQAALFEMMDINFKNSKYVGNFHSRKEEIMARFILAVSEEFRVQREVGYYAKKLFISPKHLSSVVKEISGKTAGDWIEHYVIMEAKVLLKTTDLTIQEITTCLNFPNQSFFGKYFKLRTGTSPTDFRKEQR